jgi:hypothetical protein
MTASIITTMQVETAMNADRVGIRRLPPKVQPSGGGGEMMIAGTNLDFVGLGDDLAVQDCTHGRALI